MRLAFLKMQLSARRLWGPDLSLTDKILRLLQKYHGIDYSLFPQFNHSDILFRELGEVFYRSCLTFELSYFLSCCFPHIFQTLISTKCLFLFLGGIYSEQFWLLCGGAVPGGGPQAGQQKQMFPNILF